MYVNLSFHLSSLDKTCFFLSLSNTKRIHELPVAVAITAGIETGRANVEGVVTLGLKALHASEIRSLYEPFALLTEWPSAVYYVQKSHHIAITQELVLVATKQVEEVFCAELCTIHRLHVALEFFKPNFLVTIAFHLLEKQFHRLLKVFLTGFIVCIRCVAQVLHCSSLYC